jgi:hypothetical protein
MLPRDYYRPLGIRTWKVDSGEPKIFLVGSDIFLSIRNATGHSIYLVRSFKLCFVSLPPVHIHGVVLSTGTTLHYVMIQLFWFSC